MAIPTTLMGLLPTYAQIGTWAGVLLLICRLLQGLAVGGEFSGSIVYVTEHAPISRRGFYGSWVMFSAFAGLLLGSGVSALASNLLSPESLNSWGWRIPFLLGFVLGFVGLYLRLKMPETPQFLALKKLGQIVPHPVRQAFKQAPREMFLGVGLVFLPAMGFYTLFVYLSSYMTTVLKIPLQTALLINTFSMFIIILTMPWVGLLSDKVGRKPVLFLGGMGFAILSYPLFILLQQGSFLTVFIAQACFGVLVCFAYAAIPATLVELINTNIRYTAMSFPYNFSNAVFGGTAPLMATFLIQKTGNILAPSIYLIFGGLVMCVFVWKINERGHLPLPS
jgi:MHS family proline/betaine transporter-like MFS transporter